MLYQMSGLKEVLDKTEKMLPEVESLTLFLNNKTPYFLSTSTKKYYNTLQTYTCTYQYVLLHYSFLFSWCFAQYPHFTYYEGNCLGSQPTCIVLQYFIIVKVLDTIIFII